MAICCGMMMMTLIHTRLPCICERCTPNRSPNLCCTPYGYACGQCTLYCKRVPFPTAHTSERCPQGSLRGIRSGGKKTKTCDKVVCFGGFIGERSWKMVKFLLCKNIRTHTFKGKVSQHFQQYKSLSGQFFATTCRTWRHFWQTKTRFCEILAEVNCFWRCFSGNCEKSEK